MARVLVTGASGWVGSVLARRLHADGHELVLLVRGDRGRQRLRRRAGAAVADSATVLDGDITLPDAGVNRHEIERLRGTVDTVLHLAAVVRLDEAAAAEIRRTNVGGTGHVLALAQALGAGAFCFMSSCAAGGDADTFSEDDVDRGQGFRNAYERSKLEGEKLVRGWNGRWLLLRMPGLLGDSKTGETASFAGAFYRVAAAYWMLRGELWTAWSSEDRDALRAEGIRFSDAGRLHLPIHVPFSPASRCEAIPQDWLAEMVGELLAGDARGVVHLVHPSPPTTAWTLDVMLSHLDIEPPRSGARPAEVAGPWTRFTRRIFDRLAGPHYPYLLHLPRLTGSKLAACLGARYVDPPPLDEPFLARVLDYAAQKRFSD